MPLRADPRADHPESRVGAQQRLGFTGHARRDERSRMVGAETDFDDVAEVDILVADGGPSASTPSAASKLIVIVGPRSTSAR